MKGKIMRSGVTRRGQSKDARVGEFRGSREIQGDRFDGSRTRR